MRFAIFDGKKVEATPKAKGICPNCGSQLIARCGIVKVWHWAHKGNPPCDRWWENETEWHRSWKSQFPVDWQEVAHRAESGEMHIADVQTDQEWVLEFQHSYIKPEERGARDAFYPNLVWVVDGARRKRDKAQFFKAWESGVRVSKKSWVRRVLSDECILLQEWADCSAPVFFDFRGVDQSKDAVLLWCLLPRKSNGEAYVIKVTRTGFIELHRAGAKQGNKDFAERLEEFQEIVLDDIRSCQTHERRLKALELRRLALQPQRGRSRRTKSFEQYLARKKRSQRRF